MGPDDDETGVTAAQVRDVVTRLIEAGQHKDGDPGILVVFDAGYDVTRLAYLLADLPVRGPGRALARTGCCTSRRCRAPAAVAGLLCTAGSSSSVTRRAGQSRR